MDKEIVDKLAKVKADIKNLQSIEKDYLKIIKSYLDDNPEINEIDGINYCIKKTIINNLDISIELLAKKISKSNLLKCVKPVKSNIEYFLPRCEIEQISSINQTYRIDIKRL